jgi:hypothetical protein
MAVQQPVRKEGDRNPSSVEEARSLVAYVESLFMAWNVDALVAGFTDDCVVRFGVIPEFRGRDALRKFFEARRVKQKGVSAQQAVSHVAPTRKTRPQPDRRLAD